jgi:hypothetical protein
MRGGCWFKTFMALQLKRVFWFFFAKKNGLLGRCGEVMGLKGDPSYG